VVLDLRDLMSRDHHRPSQREHASLHFAAAALFPNTSPSETRMKGGAEGPMAALGQCGKRGCASLCFIQPDCLSNRAASQTKPFDGLDQDKDNNATAARRTDGSLRREPDNWAGYPSLSCWLAAVADPTGGRSDGVIVSVGAPAGRLAGETTRASQP